jgi:hypothetical protein
MAKALTASDKRELGKLEQVVSRHAIYELEAGRALYEIKCQRLWRGKYNSFKDYLTARWDMSWDAANRLISAARVMEVLSSDGDFPQVPANSTQAVALARGVPRGTGRGGEADFSSPSARKEIVDIWAEVLETSQGRPSADFISLVVSKHRPYIKPTTIRSNLPQGFASVGAVTRVYIGANLGAPEVARRLAAVLPPAQIDDLIGELLTISRNRYAVAAD